MIDAGWVDAPLLCEVPLQQLPHDCLPTTHAPTFSCCGLLPQASVHMLNGQAALIVQNGMIKPAVSPTTQLSMEATRRGQALQTT